MSVQILTAQFDVPANMVVSVEDDDDASGDKGVFLIFGVQSATGDLALFLPYETVDRVLVALLDGAGRISSRALARIESRVADLVASHLGKTRSEMDPGPLPLPAGIEG